MSLQKSVDGMLLASASVERCSDSSARIRCNIQSETHLDFLKKTWEDFSIPYKVYVNKAGEYKYTKFLSRSSSALKSVYLRWYEDGKKKIPYDIELSQDGFALWYLGSETEDLRLKTNSTFVSRMQRQISDLGYRTRRERLEHNHYKIIVVGLTEEHFRGA